METGRRMSDKLHEVPKKVFNAYLAMFVIYPVIFLITLSFITGFSNLVKIIKIVVILCIPIIPSCVAIFYYLNRKLSRYINILLDITPADPRPEPEIMSAFINAYPLRASLSLLSGFVMGTFLALLLSYLNGVLFSVEQLFFLLILGEVPAVIVAFIIYYYAKTLLYPSNRVMEFKPLTMFYKFSIPIISTILMLLNVSNISIYKLIFEDIVKSQNEYNSEMVRRSGQMVDDLLLSILSDIRSLAAMTGFADINNKELGAYLQWLHKSKTNDIEMYFIADDRGNAFTSVGRDVYIGDRAYFRTVMEKGESYFSHPIANKATGKTSIAVVTPLKKNNRVTGLVGATILMDTLKNRLHTITQGEALFNLIIDEEGVIICHPRDEYLNLNVNNPDNRKNTELMELHDIFASRETLYGEAVLGNERIIYFTAPLASLKSSLIMIESRARHLKGFNTIIIRLSLTLIIISTITFLILRYITLKLSGPIRNTRKIFQAVAAGDLTVTPDGYLADEFGDLIRYLHILIRRLNSVMIAAMESSLQVRDSSTQLSGTSQSLSEGARDQSASIEEMSSSLEETAGAIETIAGNAREQSELATASHKSMEKLKEIILQVNRHAEEALKKAVVSTDEAVKGNELMGNTIKGMDNISGSTNKISEFISQISDISDQVNLLALNAAIEAARAGDHGRGFAVVADEITKLADQTSESARQITELVNSGHDEVARGKEYVDATSRALNNIISNIRETDILVRKIVDFARVQSESSDEVLTETKKVMEMAGNISVSTDEQMIANREMIQSIGRINEMTMQVETNSADVAASSEEINSQAELLHSHIQFFKVSKDE